MTELRHRAVPGYEWMPAGWCGGCEVCDQYPAPIVCEKCTYDRPDVWHHFELAPTSPLPDYVEFPCEHACQTCLGKPEILLTEAQHGGVPAEYGPCPDCSPRVVRE